MSALKRLIIAAVALFVIALLVYGMDAVRDNGYEKGYRKGFYAGWQSIAPKDSDGVTRVDYPLANTYFHNSRGWLVVNERFPTGSADGRIDLIDMPASTPPPGSHDIQYEGQCLSVRAIPNGDETTPDGQICVYREGELVKRVRYLGEAEITSPALMKMFKKATRKRAESLIGGKLPSRTQVSPLLGGRE